MGKSICYQPKQEFVGESIQALDKRFYILLSLNHVLERHFILSKE